MGRTACTEPQCLYNRAIPLLPLWAVRPVQSLSACTVELYLYFLYRPYGLYRSSVPIQGYTLPLPYSCGIWIRVIWYILSSWAKIDCPHYDVVLFLGDVGTRLHLPLSGNFDNHLPNYAASHAGRQVHSYPLRSQVFWHGYVLHEDIPYKSRVPRTSQMTSRLYVTRPLLCARITCYVTVITHGRCYARA
jgi:hypothetical protein